MTVTAKGLQSMSNISLPEHLLDWCEAQVALGRFASVGTYVAQLIHEDRTKSDRLRLLQLDIEEARASGISMRDPELALTYHVTHKRDYRAERLRDAIRQARASGYSHASFEGILSRAMGAQMAKAA